MIGNWRRVIGVLVVVLRLAPDLQASVCDEHPPDLYPRKFKPLLIAEELVPLIMDWYLSEVGGALPEEMDIEYYLDPEDPDNFNLYGHALFMHMSDVEGELTESTLLIQSEVGEAGVRINVPALSAQVDIVDVENEESCGLYLFCLIENGIFDLLPGMDFTVTIDESSSFIEQTAELSVLPDCTVAHPLLGTTVSLDGITTELIDESEVPQWTWDLDIFHIVEGMVNAINALVNDLMGPLMLDNMVDDI